MITTMKIENEGDVMYERMYGILFNAITDSLEQMEGYNYGLAIRILKKAQRDAEDIYMGKEDLDELEFADSSLTIHPMDGFTAF